MRTPESVVFTRLMLGGLSKGEFQEEEHPRDEGGKFSVKFEGKQVYAVESYSQADLKKLVPKSEKGTQTYQGVNVDLIERAHQFDTSEVGLAYMVQRKDGMKVYRYTDEHIQKQAEKKFQKAIRMSRVIGPLRDRIDLDLKHKDPKIKAAATIAKLIDTTYMRVGGGRTEKDTGSTGATTLRLEQVTAVPDGLRVRFLGKSGVKWDRTVTDPGIVQNMKELMKGRKKEERVFSVDGDDVNEYLKTRTKSIGGVTAKDFRTFHASRIVHDELAKSSPRTMKEAKLQIKQAIETTAEALGHTPSVCKSKYINPVILAQHLLKTGK